MQNINIAGIVCIAKKAGKYEKAGMKAIEEGTLDFSNNKEFAIVSLKVLDTISENTEDLQVKHALQILDDAKNMLLRLLSV